MKTLRRLWFLDTTATEIWLSLISISCGLWLLLPFQTISVPFSAFKVFGIGFELSFAFWLLLLGSLRLHAVICALRRRRALCAVAAFSTWIFLLLTSLFVDYRALVTVMYFVPATMSIWVFLRSNLRPCRAEKGA